MLLLFSAGVGAVGKPVKAGELKSEELIGSCAHVVPLYCSKYLFVEFHLIAPFGKSIAVVKAGSSITMLSTIRATIEFKKSA